MQRDIELRLAAGLIKRKRSARDIINELLSNGAIVSPKQAWATLEKWCDKGWYDYGVTLDLGWLTPEGINQFSAAREMEHT